MNCASWLDRPLTVAGRAVVRTRLGGGRASGLSGPDHAHHPSLAIHQQQDVNRGPRLTTPRRTCSPLCALGGGPPPSPPPAGGGLGGGRGGTSWPPTWCSAPGRRRCASGRRANSSRPPALTIWAAPTPPWRGSSARRGTERFDSLYCLFDNEEVGSGTRQGP